MSQFLSPWNVKKNAPLDRRELVRALRQSISAEQEAIHLYEAYADATNNSLAKKVFQDIANEEKVHAGEFVSVLEQIQPDEKDWLHEGYNEVEEMKTSSVELTKRLAKIAIRIAAKTYTLVKDVKTKRGAEFKSGDKLTVVSYDDKWPYFVHLEDFSGNKLILLPKFASKLLRGFSKAPSFGTMRRWMEDGVAKAIDGARVEPDGFSPDGAPSWLLVLGTI